MEKVERSGDCWLWTAACFDTGYPAFRVGNKQRRAHRWAYEHFKGPIPPGLQVMHTCDVKHCVNPAHLRAGTNLENQQDMTTKGRGRTWPRNGAVLHPQKLNPALADEIRERYAIWGVTQASLADEYHVSQTMISLIIRGLRWVQTD